MIHTPEDIKEFIEINSPNLQSSKNASFFRICNAAILSHSSSGASVHAVTSEALGIKLSTKALPSGVKDTIRCLRSFRSLTMLNRSLLHKRMTISRKVA